MKLSKKKVAVCKFEFWIQILVGFEKTNHTKNVVKKLNLNWKFGPGQGYIILSSHAKHEVRKLKWGFRARLVCHSEFKGNGGVYFETAQLRGNCADLSPVSCTRRFSIYFGGGKYSTWRAPGTKFASRYALEIVSLSSVTNIYKLMFFFNRNGLWPS